MIRSPSACSTAATEATSTVLMGRSIAPRHVVPRGSAAYPTGLIVSWMMPVRQSMAGEKSASQIDSMQQRLRV